MPFAFSGFPGKEGYSIEVIGSILFLAIFCSATGYFLYIYALDKLGVTTTILFVNLVPIVTVITSFILLHEKVTFIQLIGGAIIIFSVYMVTLNNSKKSTL